MDCKSSKCHFFKILKISRCCSYRSWYINQLETCAGIISEFFSDLKHWPLAVLQPFEQQGCLASHLKLKTNSSLLNKIVASLGMHVLLSHEMAFLQFWVPLSVKNRTKIPNKSWIKCWTKSQNFSLCSFVRFHLIRNLVAFCLMEYVFST